MKLPQLSDFNFQGKRVLVRGDLDVPLRDGAVTDDTRIRECLPTIKYLLEHGASVILMGHLDRPEGRVVEKLKMAPVQEKLTELLGSSNFTLRENLRFNPGEENNDPEFAKELASQGDFYVNEAFAASHRAHASVVGVPQLLPHCAGLHFVKEVENLSKVIENPQKPLVFVIGGAKPETKMPLVEEFKKKTDFVLVGGKLAASNDLAKDGLDINSEAIQRFLEIIKTARTIVWNGPMGKYEDEKWQEGTRKIAVAIAQSPGFKVVGGGDTIAALTKFGLLVKMDYVSTGGGAMLEFLAKGTLPGIDALK